MKALRIAAVALAGVLILGGFAFVKHEPLLLSLAGMRTEKRSLDELQAFLAPHIEAFAPEGATGRLPTIVQFPGCVGARADFSEQWARVANDAGWLAIVVDSNGARGISRDRARETVCKGKELLGQERAGDVAAALALVAARPDVDPARIVVAGWSHGAWTIMDYFALAGAGRAPSSIKDAPKDAPSVAGAILFYPHCGPGAWSRIAPWASRPPTLAFVAGADSVVDGPECKARFETIKSEGVPVEVTFYPTADHAFDDRGLEPKYQYLYNAEAEADATAKYAAFLRRLTG